MLLLLAFLLDAAIGDPRWLPHPVVWIGRLTGVLERRLRHPDKPARVLLLRGTFLVAAVLVITYGAASLLLHLFFLFHPQAGTVLTVVLLSTTLAARCLQEAAEHVAKPLQAGRLGEARHAVGMIVGRDTGYMDAGEAARATVETVAENTVDGVTAPLFYALLGGAPLALAYKAVNTLDSMLGYKNEKFLYFGRAAARLDDAANWLPARLTVPVMLLAAALLRLDVQSAYLAVHRDGRKHPSPNSGLAEALAAGALGVRLGGENSYGGRISSRPLLWGEEGRPAAAGDIGRSVRLMRCTAVLFLIFGLTARGFILFWLGKAVL